MSIASGSDPAETPPSTAPALGNPTLLLTRGGATPTGRVAFEAEHPLHTSTCNLFEWLPQPDGDYNAPEAMLTLLTLPFGLEAPGSGPNSQARPGIMTHSPDDLTLGECYTLMHGAGLFDVTYESSDDFEDACAQLRASFLSDGRCDEVTLRREGFCETAPLSIPAKPAVPGTRTTRSCVSLFTSFFSHSLNSGHPIERARDQTGPS